MNDFEVLDKIGEGTYSSVFKVKRKTDNEVYALKRVNIGNMKKKDKLNALNEVRVLASVKSKYVVAYREAFLSENDSELWFLAKIAL